MRLREGRIRRANAQCLPAALHPGDGSRVVFSTLRPNLRCAVRIVRGAAVPVRLPSRAQFGHDGPYPCGRRLCRPCLNLGVDYAECGSRRPRRFRGEVPSVRRNPQARQPTERQAQTARALLMLMPAYWLCPDGRGTERLKSTGHEARGLCRHTVCNIRAVSGVGWSRGSAIADRVARRAQVDGLRDVERPNGDLRGA
ncbi:MAG: hypothetical protein QOI01_1350 [Mycobacterium sp.]|jgi:hypothetical protein|nr:hypothetical protein [Mycobacterium sp.]